MNNLWDSPEAEAWCRGFRYEDYLMLYKKMAGSHDHALTINEYFGVCKFFSKVQSRSQE